MKKQIGYKVTPQELMPKFQIHNSWIVPCYYKYDNKIGDKDSYDYVINHYFCNDCNHMKIKKLGFFQNYINDPSLYICPNCLNEEFILINQRNKNYKKNQYKFRYNETLKYFHVDAIMDIPVVTSENEIINCESIDLSINISKQNGNIRFKESESFLTATSTVQNSLKTDLLNFLIGNILGTIDDDILDIKNKIELYPYAKFNTLEIIQKYLKYQNIKNFELLLIKEDIKNHTTLESYIQYISNYTASKSIKRILYKNFHSCISQDGCGIQYSHKVDFIICRSFNDPNIIVKILDNIHLIDFFAHYGVETMIKFFKWFQQYYTQKQICDLLNEFHPVENFYFIDIFNMYEYIIGYSPKLLNKHFH